MKKILTLILITSLIFISGCWDIQEIEQRLFVVEIGLDLNEEASEDEKMDRLNVTFQYPNINAFGKNPTGDQKSYILTGNASSIFSAGRDFMEESPFPFFYKNLKVIILGEELLQERDLVISILDELSRSTKINKRARLLAADGTALEILEANYIQEQRAEGSIYATVRDNAHLGSFTSKTLLAFINESDMEGVSIIPKITTDGDGFRVSGGCVLKDYKFLCWVSPEENTAINMANGDIGLENLDIPYKDTLIRFEIVQSSSNKKVDHNGVITITLDVNLEGSLQGHIITEAYNHYDKEEILAMEKVMEAHITEEIEKTISRLQAINADVLGVGEYLSKYHPVVWESIEDDWDQIFPETELEVNTNVMIRRVGLTK